MVYMTKVTCALDFFSGGVWLGHVKGNGFASKGTCNGNVFMDEWLLDFIYGPEKAAKIKTEDPDHKVPFNTFLHTIRPVEGGCELRSRFWVGKTIKDGEVVTVDMPEEFDMEEMYG